MNDILLYLISPDFLMSHSRKPAFSPHCLELIPPCRKRVDSRTRKDRIQQRINAWQRQIPYLAEQYLKWKATGQPCDDPSEMASWVIETVSFSGTYNWLSVKCDVSDMYHQTSEVKNSATSPTPHM